MGEHSVAPSASALSNGIHGAFGPCYCLDTDVTTPKASSSDTDKLELDCSPLASSTPSSASIASSNTTALPSPDLPGPAANFGTVELDSIYRSSFPKILNFDHMRELGLKTILTLVDEPYPLENQDFIAKSNIMHVVLPLPAHKNAFDSIPLESMERALSILLDKRNHPVLVHCNKGKHRTGCVIGCYRKINGWSMENVLEEYRKFAGAKARVLDEKYMTLFNEGEMVKALGYTTGLCGTTKPLGIPGASKQALVPGLHQASTV